MTDRLHLGALLLLVFAIGMLVGGLFWHFTIRQPQVQPIYVQTKICEYVIDPRYLDPERMRRDPGLIYPGDE